MTSRIVLERADLLIRGGMILDPIARTLRQGDIAVTDGRIAGILEPDALGSDQAAATLDADTTIVTPGLIDLHTHVFAQRTGLGLRADRIGLEQAVTTVVDAGSTGARDHAQFLEEVVGTAETRVLSWLNVARAGLVDGLDELADLDGVGGPATRSVLAEHAGRSIRGLKVRMSASVTRGTGVAALRIARELADDFTLPIMVHVGTAPPSVIDVVGLLRAGDVVTHAFHGKGDGILAEGRIHPAILDARARGVLFDVGHGSASLAFSTLERALDAGFAPDLASTDLHAENLDGPVVSQAMTLTKLLAAGMDLTDVIAASTSRAAEVIGETGSLGTLAAGSVADLSLFRMRSRPQLLTDSEGTAQETGTVLVPVGVVAAGNPRLLEGAAA